jgi:hypothetical protein
MRQGIEFRRQVMIKRSERPYASSKTFGEYVKSTFIPHVMNVSAEEKIHEEHAVLLIANWPSHITPEWIELVTGVRRKMATFAPQTTAFFRCSI